MCVWAFDHTSGSMAGVCKRIYTDLAVPPLSGNYGICWHPEITVHSINPVGKVGWFEGRYFCHNGM